MTVQILPMMVGQRIRWLVLDVYAGLYLGM
jgi:hypothetical protein